MCHWKGEFMSLPMVITVYDMHISHYIGMSYNIGKLLTSWLKQREAYDAIFDIITCTLKVPDIQYLIQLTDIFS